LRDATPEVHARGAELVVVGCGNRHFAQGFREALKLETPLYVDTERASYRALGMRRVSPLGFLTPKVMRNFWRALKAGFRQGRAQGNVWQLGGVLVVRPDGAVAFQYLSSEAGDHPPVADVLAALGS